MASCSRERSIRWGRTSLRPARCCEKSWAFEGKIAAGRAARESLAAGPAFDGSASFSLPTRRAPSLGAPRACGSPPPRPYLVSSTGEESVRCPISWRKGTRAAWELSGRYKSCRNEPCRWRGRIVVGLLSGPGRRRAACARRRQSPARASLAASQRTLPSARSRSRPPAFLFFKSPAAEAFAQPEYAAIYAHEQDGIHCRQRHRPGEGRPL